MANSINCTGDLPRYVLDSLFYNLTDKSYWNVDDRNNVNLLRIITRGSKSNFQLTIGVFAIAFAISVIEKIGEFLNTLTMQYELRYQWWINAVVMIFKGLTCKITLRKFYFVTLWVVSSSNSHVTNHFFIISLQNSIMANNVLEIKIT